MLKDLFQGLLAAVAARLLENYRHLSLRLLKIETAKSYVHGVRLARLSAIGMTGLGLSIALIGLGALLLHAGLFILLPWSLESKAVLGAGLGAVYLIMGGVALHAALSEKTWMTKSGARRMLDDALKPDAGTPS